MQSGHARIVSYGVVGSLLLSALACNTASPQPSAAAAPVSQPLVTPPDSGLDGCVVAVVNNVQHHEDAHGLTHDVTFRERMIRCPDRVWTERIRPTWAAGEHPADGHRHLPSPEHLARLVTKAPNGIRLDLVDEAEQTVIHVPAQALSAVGFGADADTAFSLISKTNIQAMKPLPGREAAKGARWLELSSERGYDRVHWSDELNLPLEVEVGTHDGRDRSHVIVTFEQAPAADRLPWKRIEGFQHREYDEFLD